MNNKPVFFRCATCEYYNKMERGMPDFINRETDFMYLTDVLQHLAINDNHYVIALVEEEK